MDNRDDDLEDRRMVDPSASFAEWLDQVRNGRSNPGTSMVKVNMRDRIGGLAFIRRREQHHEKAAERFLTLYETRFGAISPAVDPAREPVNTSIMAHDNGMAARLDATSDLRRAEVYLGATDYARIVAVVAKGKPSRDGVRKGKGKGKPTGRALEREVTALLAALDRLAEHWSLKAKKRAA